MILLAENENKRCIAVPVEICHKAKIQRVLWSAKIEVQHADLSKATAQIESDRERVIRNFSAKGLKIEEMTFLPIESFSVFGDTTIDAFHLIQKIEISSTEVQRVQKIIAESSDLLRFKVQFSAEEPTYELADFRAWLMQLLPILVAEGEQIVQSNEKMIKGKIIEFQSLRMKPIFANRFDVCNSVAGVSSTPAFGDSISVNIKAFIEYTLR